jgi:nucleotide-binding universal stress UspA family protein
MSCTIDSIYSWMNLNAQFVPCALRKNVRANPLLASLDIQLRERFPTAAKIRRWISQPIERNGPRRAWHVVCSTEVEGANMIKINHVLVATDFSEPSESALLYGRELARTFGARLHVLHVVENPAMWSGPEASGVDFARIQAELEAGAHNTLSRIISTEDREQLKAVTAVLTGGSTAFEIAGYAKACGIDIIVVGTHGRGMVGHLLMGSVAEKVVRIAPCPVLTVRHPEHEFIQPDALETVCAVKH